MANYITNTEDLTIVADAIREKGGTQALLTFPNGFVSAISNISTGIPQALLDNNGTRGYFDNFFMDCSNMTEAPMLNTSGAISVHDMFNMCTSLTTVPVYNTSNVTDFGYMFDRCSSILTLPQFDTHNGTNFQGMFSGCRRVKTIGQLNLVKATGSNALGYMFNWCWVLANVSFVANSIKSNIDFSSTSSLTNASLVSIANGLNSSVSGKALKLSPSSKNIISSLMGTVSNNTFTESTSGTISLQTFILSTKGWSIA